MAIAFLRFALWVRSDNPVRSGYAVRFGSLALRAGPCLRTLGLVGDEVVVQCSAKGCRASAVWELRWNNPKIHAADYRKSWLACAEHRETLGEFLRVRGFLRDVTPFAAIS